MNNPVFAASLYEDSSSSFSSSSVGNSTSNVFQSFDFTRYLIWFGIFVVIFIATIIILNIVRVSLWKRKSVSDWKKRVFLEIRVPKETSEDAQKDGQKKDEKEYMGIGEQVFLVISEYAKKGFAGWLYGSERFSFEMLNVGQKIKFFVVCSQKTADVLERQIISTFPKADILRHKQVNFFPENTKHSVTEMELSNNFILPFRTYKNMEKDPLNSLTSVMSGLHENESTAIQIVIEPVNGKQWQKNSRKLALEIQQGKNPDNVLKKPTAGDGIKGIIKGTFKIIKDVFKGVGRALLNKKDDENKSEHENRDIDFTGNKQAIQLTPLQQDIIKKLEEKSSRPGFKTVIRLVSAAATEVRAEQIIQNIIPAFQIFDVRPYNGFKKKKVDQKQALLNFILRTPVLSDKNLLNTEELNSLWHLPSYLVTNSYIEWLTAKKPSLPLEIPGPGQDRVFIGKARSGMQEKDVYMKLEDRYRHVYTLGGSGSGKSVFLTNMVLQDIEQGHGVCVVDPHGETIDDILLRVPKNRKDDVIIFSPAFTDRPLGLNMLEYDRLKPTQRTIVIDTLFSIWDKLYDLKATGGPMFETYMKNAMRLVMSHEPSGSTLLEISKVLTNEDYRTFKLAMCDEEQVVDFWEKEAQKAGGEAALENMVPYITSKLSPFVNNDFIRPMVGQQKSAINFREAMDNKKIVLLKLEKGMIGDQSAYLIGMVVIGNLLMAGLGRSDGKKYNLDGTVEDIQPKDRPGFFIYVDEMQNFLFDAIPKALEEIRKYKVGMILAHQFVKQVIKQGDERIKDSIFANCASKFIFRAGAEDAEYLVKEYGPTLTSADLQNPERFTCNTILLVDGQKTTPFNLKPPPLSDTIDIEFKAQIIEETKQKYGSPPEIIEKEIKERVDKFMF
jgi:hypothetical protein